MNTPSIPDDQKYLFQSVPVGEFVSWIEKLKDIMEECYGTEVVVADILTQRLPGVELTPVIDGDVPDLREKTMKARDQWADVAPPHIYNLIGIRFPKWKGEGIPVNSKVWSHTTGQ